MSRKKNNKGLQTIMQWVEERTRDEEKPDIPRIIRGEYIIIPRYCDFCGFRQYVPVEPKEEEQKNKKVHWMCRNCSYTNEQIFNIPPVEFSDSDEDNNEESKWIDDTWTEEDNNTDKHRPIDWSLPTAIDNSSLYPDKVVGIKTAEENDDDKYKVLGIAYPNSCELPHSTEEQPHVTIDSIKVERDYNPSEMRVAGGMMQIFQPGPERKIVTVLKTITTKRDIRKVKEEWIGDKLENSTIIYQHYYD